MKKSIFFGKTPCKDARVGIDEDDREEGMRTSSTGPVYIYLTFFSIRNPKTNSPRIDSLESVKSTSVG